MIAETPKGRHSSERKVENVQVTKVGRKYFSVVFDGGKREHDFYLNSWRRAGENVHTNFPINLFRTHQEMDDRNEKNETVRMLADNLCYCSDWAKLDLTVLREVARLTGLKAR